MQWSLHYLITQFVSCNEAFITSLHSLYHAMKPSLSHYTVCLMQWSLNYLITQFVSCNEAFITSLHSLYHAMKPSLPHYTVCIMQWSLHYSWTHTWHTRTNSCMESRIHLTYTLAFLSYQMRIWIDCVNLLLDVPRFFLVRVFFLLTIQW